jgi:nucleotide-binding universal stress UspA family protein
VACATHWPAYTKQNLSLWRSSIYQHILIPTDGSALSAKGVEEGVKLARSLGSRVTFLIATTPFSSMGDLGHAFAGAPEAFRRQALEYLNEDALKALAAASSVAEAAGVTAGAIKVESDHPHEVIIDTAKSKGADLILMASHGRSGLKAAFLGSVTQKVVAHSHLPVLICR